MEIQSTSDSSKSPNLGKSCSALTTKSGVAIVKFHKKYKNSFHVTYKLMKSWTTYYVYWKWIIEPDDIVTQVVFLQARRITEVCWTKFLSTYKPSVVKGA